MGTCYYLVRRDNRTGYDLGKSYGWEEAFSTRSVMASFRRDVNAPMILRREDADTLVDLIVLASKPYGWCRTKEDREYLRIVALDIVDWADGQPFEYHSEHSGLIEDLYMEGWDLNTPPRKWITGDRHTGHMIDKFRERHGL